VRGKPLLQFASPAHLQNSREIRMLQNPKNHLHKICGTALWTGLHLTESKHDKSPQYFLD
jgi:hypothetical protein